jgi:hypothetical protein
MHLIGRIILRVTLTGIILSLAILLRSQEMWGLTTSNFAGSTGALLNPSSIVNSKLYLDINLVTVDAFFKNDYAYIHNEDYSLFKYLNKDPQFPEYGPDAMAFDHFTTKSNKFAYASEFVKGPSAMLVYGRHAFAIHTAARALSSMNRIPYHLLNFGYYGLDYLPQQNINYKNQDFGAAALTLGEVGATYAYAFRRYSNEDWSAGITAKYLFSMGGGYLYATDANYMVINDSTIDIKNINAEVGIAIPMDYDNNEFPDDGGWIKGRGVGLDIGVTFQNKILSYQKKRIGKLCRQKYIDYTYKVGISIIDLGFVNFKNNAQLHTYENVSEYWIGIDTMSYYNLNQLARTLSEVFYGDPQASYQGNKIKIFLPTAFSIQGDYKVYKNWYAGGVVILPLVLGKSYIHRPPQVALIPRYETPQLEFAMPLSLFSWKYPRMGLSARYEFLSIGTDDLLGLVGLTNFTGIDFYVSVKFNFRKGNCGRYNRNVPCENDEYGIRNRR